MLKGTKGTVQSQDRERTEGGCQNVMFEQRSSKSPAINTGLRDARGVLAFTDDDAIVESTWVQNLTLGLDNGEWAGAGGRSSGPDLLTSSLASAPPLGRNGAHWAIRSRSVSWFLARGDERRLMALNATDHRIRCLHSEVRCGGPNWCENVRTSPTFPFERP
jgi:hypothetical protein